MSYILEALRKADQQREIGQVPGIGAAHEQTPAQTSRRWLWLIAVTLLLNAVLLAVLLWPDPESQTLAGPGASPADTRQEPRSVAQLSDPGQVLQRPVPQPVPVAPQAEEAPQPETREDAAAARLEPEKPVLAAVQQPPPEPPPLRRPPQAVAEPPLPVWPQIPSHLFQQLNRGLRLDVHVYSDEEQDRFVLINLQKYHEGEQLQEGPQLDEITEDGVILSFRGQRFRVRAQ